MISTNSPSLITVTVLLLFEGSAGQLVFHDSPASATVLVNYPTTLTCSAYEPTPPENILWLRDGVVADSNGKVLINYNSTSGASGYIINTVSYLDAGDYQCFAMNGSGSILASSNVGSLTVQGHPGFAHPLPSMTVPLGGSVTYNCAVLSDPPATVTWSFEYGATAISLTSNERVTISPPTSLTITNVEASDEGFYVCSATNSFGRNTTSGRLIIGDPPPRLDLILSPSSPDPLPLNQGGSLSLSCSVASDSHLSSLQWFKNSTLLEADMTQTSNSLLLSIPSVQFEDGGLYSCTAMDGSGNSDTVSISVVVNVPPQFTTTPDDLLTVEDVPVTTESSCSAVGVPVPSITWLRSDGTTLPVVDGSPQFGSLSRSDTGVFSCVASNVAGEVRHAFTVTVQGPPSFLLSPADTNASPGQDVVFHCLAEGPPDPQYSWGRAGGEGLPQGAIVSSDGTQLHLFSVSVEDEGTYECSTSNSLGKGSAEANLNILPRPQILNATTGPIYVAVSSGFSLSCTYSGPPSTVLLWYANGILLSPDLDPNLTLSPPGSLSVTNSQQRYSGEYVCNVSTTYAFDIARVSVIVGNSPQIITSPPNLDLFPGSNGELSCGTTGVPQPWTTWFKTANTGVMTELPTVGATFTKLATGLELHDVIREDSGVYECRVQNGIGSAMQTATVRVEGIPIVTGIRPVELIANTNISLRCSVDFNYPTGSVSWSRGDGLTLPSDRFTTDSNGDLVVSLVSVEDEADYVCTVSNSYGESSIRTAIVVYANPTINLAATQVIAIVNTDLVVSCPVSGRPLPTVQWILSDGTNPDKSSGFSVGPLSDELTLSNPNLSHEGLVTCIATNLLGNASAQIEILVRGPAVSNFIVQIQSTTGVTVVWTAPPTISSASLLQYNLDYGRHGALSNRTVEIEVNQLQTSVNDLSPGTTYEFVMRGLFSGGLLGDNISAIATTLETVPTGPPQNIIVSAREEALEVNWIQPLESERNGVIISYTVLYHETPFDASFDPPFITLPYTRGDELQHTLVIGNLTAMISYDIRILASTAVGDGPESATFRGIPLPRKTFDLVDFSLVTTVVIAVGAAVLGSLLLVAVVMVICLVSILGWRRYKKMGKHIPFVEETEFNGQKKKSKSISGPIPGITPQFDNSVDGKFIVHGQNGRVLNLNPKIITEEDVATPPKQGHNVQVVPRENILVSQRRSGTYDMPTDAISSGGYSVPHPHSNQPRNGRVVRPESGIYSEVQDVRTVQVRKETEEQTDSYEPHDSDVWGREAAEESETNLVDNGPEIIVMQPPSPERRAPEGDDNGNDKAQLIYASISSKHKQKKRIQMEKLQEEEELKLAKQQKKMQEKMEKEQKKQEARWRKEEVKLRKKESREQQLRSSMGLDNVVHLHELDPSSRNARAQADFIDSATAALF